MVFCLTDLVIQTTRECGLFLAFLVVKIVHLGQKFVLHSSSLVAIELFKFLEYLLYQCSRANDFGLHFALK